MSKIILGIDLGSNSIGWGLLKADGNMLPESVVDAGVRIFPKAVEEKTPTPKNQKRRTRRLMRRTIQRRARRKQKMLNLCLSLALLPRELLDEPRPEGILNGLGDPYQLRRKALDHPLSPHELGRVLLHLVQRRGFLSNKKTLLGRDMLDDPDVLSILGDEEPSGDDNAEESAFKADISALRRDINSAGCRTLGEYLAAKTQHENQRNRNEQHLRTDRQMYRDELSLIFAEQCLHHDVLTSEIQDKIEHVIFHQRPIRYKKDRVGNCSLEPKNKRAAVARMEYQRFRYLQDINHLEYRDVYSDEFLRLSDQDRERLKSLFEVTGSVTFAKIRSTLGMDKKTDFNLDSGVKKIRGNTTAAAVIELWPAWENLAQSEQYKLVDDLLSIQKKSALKRRLMNHWGMSGECAVQLCLIEFEPDHGKVSLKAIRKLLPYLEKGLIYSDARVAAGYGYELQSIESTAACDKLGAPPELPNPIVNRALHELKRVVNAIIREYGKPDVIRIEMARDLEMNTKRYKGYLDQQRKNTAANEKATNAYRQIGSEHPGLALSKYPSRDQKIRYRLWEDQGHCCVYSGKTINLATLFSADVEVDHILPYSQSLDDSYMNKVVCLARENQVKGQKTPVDAFGQDEEKWNQISQAISRWPRSLSSKRNRFHQSESDLLERDFIGNQLTDTRYICREAGSYLGTLGTEVTFTKGIMTDWLRRQWDLNDLIGNTIEKERTDHRHHAIDAIVTACIDRGLYNGLVAQSKSLEKSRSPVTMRDLYFTPPIIDIKEQLAHTLGDLIVSHTPQHKIAGALHEETGVGFIEGIGTVYRQRLDKDFTLKRAEEIIDAAVRSLVIAHLEQHNGDAKKAFSEGFELFHLDGKTPIKRVRVVQAKTTLEKLEESKFAIRDTTGKAFKWHAFGNIHHVEILREKQGKKKYRSEFVTAMEAAKRVRAKGQEKQPLVRTDHGEDWGLVMALHANDLVRVTVDGEKKFYRVQNFERDGLKATLRLHSAATLKVSSEGIRKSINTLISKFEIELVRVNAIGKILDDKTYS